MLSLKFSSFHAATYHASLAHRLNHVLVSTASTRKGFKKTQDRAREIFNDNHAEQMEKIWDETAAIGEPRIRDSWFNSETVEDVERHERASGKVWLVKLAKLKAKVEGDASTIGSVASSDSLEW